MKIIFTVVNNRKTKQYSLHRQILLLKYLFLKTNQPNVVRCKDSSDMMELLLYRKAATHTPLSGYLKDPGLESSPYVE